nr:hypothetical protein - rat [Rattus norvegicus]
KGSTSNVQQRQQQQQPDLSKAVS